MKLKGDLFVSREVNSKRSNEAMATETLAADKALTRYDAAWQALDPDGSDREVALPDATTLENGWKIIVHHAGTADALNVTNESGGAIIKTITAPESVNDTKAYQFVLLDNSTTDGLWYVIELGDSQTLVAQRFVANFVTADWPAAASGYRTLTSTQVSGLGVATHGRGTTPTFLIQEKSGTDYDRVMLDRERTDASGNLSLRIIDGDQFDGRVILI